jgi:Calx-beta domain-containing protein
MNKHLFPRTYLTLVLFAMGARSQVAPKLITGPDQFEFISAAYFASQGVSNAIITVRFTPGDPSWNGSVNYSTTNGTAIPNKDYAPVSGTLYFSGVSYRSFSVPIASRSAGQPEKNLGLLLTPSPGDTGAVILRGSALLYINLPVPPKLDISAGPNGTVSISWLDDGTGPVLEKSTEPGTGWTVVSAWPTSVNGRMTVTEPAAVAMSLYRLRRSQ